MTHELQPPTIADATHLLDNHEPVTKVRLAREIMRDVAATDRRQQERGSDFAFYPQIDRARMTQHGLCLVHNIPRNRADYCGELLVTGDRLKPLPK